ncbi:hypothetical protein [Halocynthiibacter namhaensis]|uniref:hypothetical protein n=1 Tax=Halocynthiibacter namhaensis TaxID=1290553 RepID=UPI0005798A86|nr:hypothetical protein [Halocynthiibacter namhaensis]
MSNTDSFIDEVTEEVRQEQLWTMVRRYGWVAALAVVGIVGGATWNEINKSNTAAAAQAAGDGIVAALENDDSALRADDLAAARASVDAQSGAANVLGFYEATETAEAGDTDRAAKLYAEIAANTSLAPVYRDLATFKGASLPGVDAAAARSAFESISAAGAPFRLLAEEQIAIQDMTAGDTEAALTRLQNIAIDSEVTPGQRSRVVQLIEILGGSLETT